MNLAIILLVALVALMITRIPFILLYNSQQEPYKSFERVCLSFGILGMFLVIWGVIIGVYTSRNQVFDNLIWYCIFTFFGIASIIWCYFRWDLKWKAIPKIEEDKMLVALKKILVFAVVMLFAFYHGYMQLESIMKDEKVDNALAIYNITLISGIIALDRVLNQVSIVYKEWKENYKKKEAEKKKE